MLSIRYIFGVGKMINLSDYVRQTVSRKGLSSNEVQKRSRHGISFGYVNDILNGRTVNVSVDKLKALALGLGVSEDELFRVARGLPIEPAEDPMEAELITRFQHLSSRRKLEMLQLFEFYTDYDIRVGDVDQSEADPMDDTP